jgi:hypothetical protein
LAGVVIEDYRVLLDKQDVDALMADLHMRSTGPGESAAAVARRASALFAKQLVVGIKRFARGERLSAHDRIRGEAVRQLLTLADALSANYPDPGACVVDPFRRFEPRRPELAARLLAALELPTLVCAAVLIDLATAELDASPIALTDAGLVAVRQLLARVSQLPDRQALS